MKIQLGEKTIEYSLARKKVKNINLRILPDGNIKVSAPQNAPMDRIEEIFYNHEQRILGILKEFDIRRNISIPVYQGEDCSLSIFGQKVSIIHINDRNRYDFDGINLIIYSTSETARFKIFSDFIAEIAVPYFKEIADEIIPTFPKDRQDMPTISIKKMKSRWGSCHIVKKHITINEMLYAVPPILNRYIMLHELCHIIHPDHSKDFHNLLETLLPNHRNHQKEIHKYSSLLLT